jgi:Skp family chaperone for outer membrane proteins
MLILDRCDVSRDETTMTTCPARIVWRCFVCVAVVLLSACLSVEKSTKAPAALSADRLTVARIDTTRLFRESEIGMAAAHALQQRKDDAQRQLDLAAADLNNLTLQIKRRSTTVTAWERRQDAAAIERARQQAVQAKDALQSELRSVEREVLAKLNEALNGTLREYATRNSYDVIYDASKAEAVWSSARATNYLAGQPAATWRAADEGVPDVTKEVIALADVQLANNIFAAAGFDEKRQVAASMPIGDARSSIGNDSHRTQGVEPRLVVGMTADEVEPVLLEYLGKRGWDNDVRAWKRTKEDLSFAMFASGGGVVPAVVTVGDLELKFAEGKLQSFRRVPQ